MNKILVTGASGQLGRATLDHLLQTTPPSQIAALARDPGKLAGFAERGIDVRQGDYFDYDSLARAFRGADKLMMISAHAFTDRETQHGNILTAAKAAGVRHVAYTSIQRREGSALVIPQVTQSDLWTERALRETGLRYTILRNTLYLDGLPIILGPRVFEDGVRVPAGNGKAALATRDDMAAGNAAVLTQEGHEDKVYTLGASEAFTFSEVAAALGEIAGQPIPYIDVDRQEFIDATIKAGIPAPGAAFMAEWVDAIAAGEFTQITRDLERLIGRPPLGYRDFLRTTFPAPQPAK